MVQDRIEREIVVAAPRERVWEIIMQAEHWASGSATRRRSICSLVARSPLWWQKHGTVYATIEKIDEPHSFSYRWMPGKIGEKPVRDNSTLVEFTLTPQGEQTRLRVVETGFGGLAMNESERAEQFDDNTEGWASKLHALQQYAEQLPV
jgi:uncharacterized protein YndB with AHSA1/START domain